MDPFRVMRTRGHIMEGDDTSVVGRPTGGPGEGPGAGDDATSRRGVYVQNRRLSRQDTRTPHDLRRSRRVGLSRIVCGSCGAVYGETCTHHDRYCAAPAREFPRLRVRQATGPMATDETSKDVGWHVVGDLET